MRINSIYWEVIDGQTRVRHESEEAARAARGSGQVRRRVQAIDVEAAYAVRLADGTEVGRASRAEEAGKLSRDHPGSKVFMVAAEPPTAN